MKVCETCGNEFTRQDSLNRHVNTICEPPDSWEKCKTCGKSYIEIGNHYQYNPTHRPNISEHQKEIITGILMGDGYIRRDDPSLRFGVSAVTKEYIQYVEEKLQPLTKDIYEPPISENSVQQQFTLNTVVHPGLEMFAEWYTTGEKIFPNDIEVTPTVLKHWYCCDGNLNTGRYPNIRVWNERDNPDKLIKYFEDTPLTASCSSGTLRFPSSKDEFFEYIGKPLPGFEHKWP